MHENEPRRRWTTDQKRAMVILLVIAGVIAVVAIGIGWLAVSIGVPLWIAVIIAVVVTAVVGLFMLLNLL